MEQTTDEERSASVVDSSEKTAENVESPAPHNLATPPSAINNGQLSELRDDPDGASRCTDSPPATIDLNHESPIGLVADTVSNLRQQEPPAAAPQLSPSSGSSSSSTPLSSPFKPHFTILSVKIASQKESLNQSPEFATYIIESKCNTRGGVNGANVTDNNGSNVSGDIEVYLVKRQWEDIEFLDHCLASSAFPSDGLIIPPLPDKYVPTSDDSIDGSYDHMLKSLSAPSSKYKSSLIKPLWVKDCDEIIEYLNLMLSHPIFGKNYDYWNRFLTAAKPAPRISRRKDNTSIMTKISDTFSSGTSASSASLTHSSNISSGNAALAESSVSSQSTFSRTYLLSHRDCEDYFQHQKEWVHSYKIYTKNTLDAFNSLIEAKGKLYRVLGHFSTALTLMTTSPNESTQSKKAFKFFNRFSTSLDEYRKSFLLSSYNDEATLGRCLDLWTRYLDSEKQMLLRRTALLLAYESANRNLDKVKGPKRDELNVGDHVSRVDRMIDSATTMLPETFYQQERNRRLVQVVRAVAAAAAAAGQTNITAVLPTRSTYHLRQLRPNRQAVNTAIHPTDGSVEIDLRELLKKELEERSKLLHPGIATSVSPDISNANQANHYSSAPSSASSSSSSSNSGVNLFALLPLNLADESSGVSVIDDTHQHSPSSSFADVLSTSSNNGKGDRILHVHKYPISYSTSTLPSVTRVKSKKKNTNGHSLTPQSSLNSLGSDSSVNNNTSSSSSTNNGAFSLLVPSTSSSAGVNYTPPRSGIRPPPVARPPVHLLRPGDFVTSLVSSTTTPKPSKKVTFVTHVDPPTVTRVSSNSRTHVHQLPVRVNSPPATTHLNGRGDDNLPPKGAPIDWSLRKIVDSKHSYDASRKNFTAFYTSTTISSNDSQGEPFIPSSNKRATVTSTAPYSFSTQLPEINATRGVHLSPIDHSKDIDDDSDDESSVHKSPGNSITDDLSNGSLGDTGAEEGILNTAVIPAPPGLNDVSSEGNDVSLNVGKKHTTLDNGPPSFYPGSSGKSSESYRLTTERLAYILIGSCCALSVLCLIAVAFSIRCRDMCDEYRAWKKAEKLAVYSNLRYNRRIRSKASPSNHQLISQAHHHQLGRFKSPSSGSRPGVLHDPYLVNDSNSSSYPPDLPPLSRPIFGRSCCCPAPAATGHSDVSCPKGYCHPTARGKLPFGAASTVTTFLPLAQPPVNSHPRNGNSSDGEDDDSLNSFPHTQNHIQSIAHNNANHMMNKNTNYHRRHSKSHSNMYLHPPPAPPPPPPPQAAHHQQQQQQHKHPSPPRLRGDSHSSDTNNECTCEPMYTYVPRPSASSVPLKQAQGKHLRPLTVDTSSLLSPVNPSWIQSSIIVDELHRKHANLLQQKHSSSSSQFLLKSRSGNVMNHQASAHNDSNKHAPSSSNHVHRSRVNKQSSGKSNQHHSQSNDHSNDNCHRKLSTCSPRLITCHNEHIDKNITTSFNTSSCSNISNNGDPSKSTGHNVRSAIFWSTNDDRLI